jgi:glycerol uptake facilitator-like aquaporin
VFVGSDALRQVWLFVIVPPFAGAVAGWLFRNCVLAP